MRAFFVNADDFGFRAEVNRAVLEGVRSGVLASASLLANMPATLEAVTLARTHPQLDVGVHLNLTLGQPLASPSAIPSLLGRDGSFPGGIGRLLWRQWRGGIRREEVQREWEAQIARIVDLGIRPAHLDGHHHAHLIPGFLPLAAGLARRFDIPAIRNPGRIFRSSRAGDWRETAKGHLLDRWAEAGRSQTEPLQSCDFFAELPISLQNSADLASFLERLLPRWRDGLLEIAYHPGYAGSDPEAPSFPGPDPVTTALSHPATRATFESNGIQWLMRRPEHSNTGGIRP